MSEKLSLNIIIILLLGFFNSCTEIKPSIIIFAGSASKPAIEEITIAFEKKTGIEVNLNLGGSGTVLSQMILSKKGDVYFPGSSDFMEIAKKKNIIFESSEKEAAYLIPSLIVKRGNPKNIKSLNDLLRDDIEILIANPQYVCLGTYSVEIFEHHFSDEDLNKLKNKIINYTGSCSKTAAAISLKTADAIIGWNVFESWDSTRLESISLIDTQIVRIGYLPIAISKYSNNTEIAQQFIDFIIDGDGKSIFEKHHYILSKEDAIKKIGSNKPIGGLYQLPASWIEK